jgi:ribosomal-protein-serine acetyltransferase
MHRLKLPVAESLELRQIAEEDVVDLTVLIDRNRAYLKQWLPWLDKSADIQDTARFIGRSLEQALNNNGLTFGIVFKGSLAGVVGQVYMDAAASETELGYWLDAHHQGRGIVTRAAARLIDYAFEEQNCERVIMHCAVGNTKSRAVPERLGFVQEGILRDAEWLYDHYVDLVAYSILKAAWITRPAAARQAQT